MAEGTRSQFALRPSDVLFGRSTVSYALRLVDGTQIIFDGLEDRGQRILDAWRRFESDPIGEPTFPPVRVHPQEWAHWQGWMAAAWIAAGAGLLAQFALPCAVPKALVAVAWTLFFLGVRKRLRRLSAVDAKARATQHDLPPLLLVDSGRTLKDGVRTEVPIPTAE